MDRAAHHTAGKSFPGDEILFLVASPGHLRELQEFIKAGVERLSLCPVALQALSNYGASAGWGGGADEDQQASVLLGPGTQSAQQSP